MVFHFISGKNKIPLVLSNICFIFVAENKDHKQVDMGNRFYGKDFPYSFLSFWLKINATCGRPLVALFFGILLFSFVSCNKDEQLNLMPQYYQESQGLINTNVDSIHRFREKFQGYLKKSPKSTSDKLYNPTVTNIRSAYREFGVDLISFSINVCVTIDYRWEGDTIIYF